MAARDRVRLGVLRLPCNALRRAFTYAVHRRTGVGYAISAWLSVIVPAYNEAANIAATVTIPVRTATTRCWRSSSSTTVRPTTPRTSCSSHAAAGRHGDPASPTPANRLRSTPASRTPAVRHCSCWSTATPSSSLTRSVASSSRSPTRGVGAVSGNTKVANRRGLLGRWQHLEYVIGFNLDRRMFDIAECMPTVPGRDRRVPPRRARRRRRSVRPTPSPRTPTSPWRSPGPVGASCTSRTRSLAPRRRRPSGSSGGSGTAGATAPCRRCGNIAPS